MSSEMTDGMGILQQRIYEEIAGIFAGKGLSHEQIAALMDDRKEAVELIMRLITSQKAIWEKEAENKGRRIELLGIISHNMDNGEKVKSHAAFPKVQTVNERIAQLSTEDVKES